MNLFDKHDDELTGIDYHMAGMGQRLPLMLCLDTSGSMQGAPIKELNKALQGWAAELTSDAHLKASVDIGIVTFGSGGVRAWRGDQPIVPGAGQSPFVPAGQFRSPEFSAAGVTLLTEALELAIRHVNNYKGWLKDNNYLYYRPLIFVITDGLPTDDQGKQTDTWQRVLPQLKSGTQGKNFQLWAIGVGHLNERSKQVLGELAPGGFRALEGFPFQSMLRQLSASIGEMMRSRDPDSVDFDSQFREAPEGAEKDPISWIFEQRPAAG